jgi:hypothetical protein
MWIEVLLPAQCLVMGGRGPLRRHSAAERSAHTTWKSAVSVHLRLLVGSIASSEALGVGCAREPAGCPCSVRVLLPTPADSNQERTGNRRETLGSYRCVLVAVTALGRLRISCSTI